MLKELLELQKLHFDFIYINHIIKQIMDFDKIKINETQSLQCRECGKKFCRKKWAERHEKKCTKSISKRFKRFKAKQRCLTHNIIYICSECNQAFHSDRALKIHSFAEHNIKKIYKCEPCGRLFNYECYLRKHSIVHTLENRFKCNFCEVLTTFKTHLQLYQHLLKTHFTY
ncbi:hypothetical protein LDVICp061 [lymphocystis disease virus-China]|uniref:C2H2-type domain-containing protein n=2 Tax=Lymphocystis disease virus 2 TaxID=159183 RepID=A0A6F8WZM3_9VIRU|nr:hypothetical protein LDVICp061 [lymphocystis disease virus-China]AAU10907.1 hypothetical protein [lymphocystis disease virus-China]BCB67447.1 hypothetical protein [Lymphocystis disease virus 2]